MDFERNIVKLSDSSRGITLPPDLLSYLELDAGDTIVLRDEKGRHGPYVSFWKKNVKEAAISRKA